MLTVACVLSGDSEHYNKSHVKRLCSQVAPNLSQQFQFVCIQDSPFPGWWAKISLFEPGRFEGRVLYLDLDVTVVGGLDDIASIDAHFAAIRDYQYPITLNSSVMTWDAGAADHVFTDFTPDVMDRYRGDQNWIYNRIPGFRRFPQDWCPSYKLQKLMGKPMPEDARVVVYHGDLKPWQLDG